MIYWVRSGYVGPVKVGYAVTVHRRIALLQTGNPLPLVLLRKEPGTRRLEQNLHAFYAPKRLRGEWFLLDEADVFVALDQVAASLDEARRGCHLETHLQKRDRIWTPERRAEQGRKQAAAWGDPERRASRLTLLADGRRTLQREAA